MLQSKKLFMVITCATLLSNACPVHADNGKMIEAFVCSIIATVTYGYGLNCFFGASKEKDSGEKMASYVIGGVLHLVTFGLVGRAGNLVGDCLRERKERTRKKTSSTGELRSHQRDNQRGRDKGLPVEFRFERYHYGK